MKQFADIVRRYSRFLITTHALPDGDGLGSELALHGYLQAVGKQSVVLNSHPTPAKFRIVDPNQAVQVFIPGMKLPLVDVVIVLDTSELSRLGPLENPIRNSQLPVVFIDHHISDMDSSGMHVIDDNFGSTGELVHNLLKGVGAEITRDIAMALYVAIVTDTSSFRFKRTTANSHLIAAELLTLGISPEDVYRHIYARDSFAKMRLLGHVLETMKSTADDRIAWLTVTREMRNYYQATIEDTESFVQQLTLIENVDIGVLFREEDNGEIKVSFRGNNETSVFEIAKQFGGGGHRFSAGVRLSLALEEAIRLVLQAAREALKQKRK